MVGQFLDRFDRGRHLLAMAMRSVDDDEVAFRIDQRLAALQTGFTHGGGGSDAQAARRVVPGTLVIRVGAAEHTPLPGLRVLDIDSAEDLL